MSPRPTASGSFVNLQSTDVNYLFTLISGFRHDPDEICALLGCNAASSGNPLPTFRDNVSVPSSRVKKSKKSSLLVFLTLEDGTDTLSRNVGKGLPLDAALYPRRAQILPFYLYTKFYSRDFQTRKVTLKFVSYLRTQIQYRFA
jgi:hypothetical protein